MLEWLGVVGLVGGCGIARVPVYGEGSEGHQRYERPERDGECSDDLDCVEGGCGNHCVSIEAEPFEGTCLYASHLDYARCGCVASRCRWAAHAGGAD